MTGLDRRFDEFVSLLDRVAVPAVRAIAISRFLDSIPSDAPGLAFYVDSLHIRLIDAVLDPGFELRDPTHRERVCACLAFCEAAGSPDEVTPARAAAARAAAGRIPEEAGPASPPRYAAAIDIPVVHDLHGVPFRGEDAEPPGFVFRVLARPRSSANGGRRDNWCYQGFWTESEARTRIENISAGSWTAAEEAALRFLEDATPGSEQRNPIVIWNSVQVDLLVTEPTVSIAGESAGLPLAAVLAGILVAAARDGEGLRPCVRYAWTGVATPDGRVVPVSKRSLTSKVRAAFYQGFSGIVVPEGMAEQAREAVPGEASDFRIRAISDLAEALKDPDLFEPWRLPGDLFPRRRTLWITIWMACAALFGAVVGHYVPPAWNDLTREFVPAMATTVGVAGVRALTEDGDYRNYVLPDTVAQHVGNARILPTHLKSPSRLVLAWTVRPGNDSHADLIGWLPNGKPVFDIATTEDSPFNDALKNRWKQVAEIRSLDLREPSVADFALAEGSDMFTGVLRVFGIEADDGRFVPRERFRWYNIGHVSDVEATAAPDSASYGSDLVWVTGPTNLRVMVDAAHGIHANSFYFTCLPVDESAVALFPPDARLSGSFLEGGGSQVARGAELFYFAIRGFEWDDANEINWLDSEYGLEIESVTWVRKNGIVRAEIQTNRSLAITVEFASLDQVHVGFGATGELLKFLGRKRTAGRTEYASFVADSLVALAYSRPGLQIEADCVDLRHDLDLYSKARELAGADGRTFLAPELHGVPSR